MASVTGVASAELLQELGGERRGGGGVLARDEVAVDDHVRRPRLALLEVGAGLHEPVLQQPLGLVGETGLRLLGVGEAGQPVAREGVGAVLLRGGQQRGRGVADDTERLAGLQGEGEEPPESALTARSSMGPWPPG